MATEYSVTLSSKGQLTLPARVRRALNLERGARIRLVVRDDGTVELTKPAFARIADVAGIGHAPAMRVSPAEAREDAHVDRWQAKQERSR